VIEQEIERLDSQDLADFDREWRVGSWLRSRVEQIIDGREGETKTGEAPASSSKEEIFTRPTPAQNILEALYNEMEHREDSVAEFTSSAAARA